MGDVFNPVFVRNVSNSCSALLPYGVARYVSSNMDTIPKFLHHLLIAMGVCNFFLLFSSLSISFLTFLACFLLTVQNASTYLVTAPPGPFPVPRLFTPTDFMLGVCLGITIGGTILSFFLCLTFGRIHTYCLHHPEGPESCGWRLTGLNGVWWWSSCIFWLDLTCCFLLALGHNEISSQSTMQQYQSLETEDPSLGNSHQSYNQYQQHNQQSPPAFAQRQGLYGDGGYNNIPDIAPPSNNVAPPTSSHPLQGTLSV